MHFQQENVLYKITPLFHKALKLQVLNHLYMTNLEDRVAHMKALNYTLLHLFICMGQKGDNIYSMFWLISLALKISSKQLKT
jgi:hypothetical protein